MEPINYYFSQYPIQFVGNLDIEDNYNYARKRAIGNIDRKSNIPKILEFLELYYKKPFEKLCDPNNLVKYPLLHFCDTAQECVGVFKFCDYNFGDLDNTYYRGAGIPTLKFNELNRACGFQDCRPNVSRANCFKYGWVIYIDALFDVYNISIEKIIRLRREQLNNLYYHGLIENQIGKGPEIDYAIFVPTKYFVRLGNLESQEIQEITSVDNPYINV